VRSVADWFGLRARKILGALTPRNFLIVLCLCCVETFNAAVPQRKMEYHMDKVGEVYKEKKHELVKSSHGDGINYRIFYGDVNWTGDPDNDIRAFVVFVQYGNEPNWETALQKTASGRKQIALKMPAHILEEDFDIVASACMRLRHRVRTEGV
jgi:hypothetical protein